MQEPNNDKREKSLKHVSESEAKDAYFLAAESMGTLNKNAAGLMKKYNCFGATDITGFGLLGHAKNLASVQKKNFSLKINIKI